MAFADLTAALPATIATDRLVLRVPDLGDMDAIANLANNAAIHRWLARLPFPYHQNDAHQFITELARTDDEHAFSITLTDGTLIGVIGLHNHAPDQPELGYWLGEPYWGRGYASEAVAALVATTETTSLTAAIAARVQTANTASFSVLRKSGFAAISAGIDDCGVHKGVHLTHLVRRPGRVRLAGPNVVLRQPEITDAEAIAALLNNPGIAKNLATVPLPYAIKDALEWLPAKVDNPPPEQTSLAIEVDARLAGVIGFHRDSAGDVEIGYWLDQPHWGRGLMSEAVGLILDWYFRTTGAAAIVSGFFAGNDASWAVQRKFGFVQTGRTRVACLARGCDVELIETVLTRTAFLAAGGAA